MMECDTPEEAQRKSVQRLIERYYYQLTQGCGRHCDNPLCFSSGAITSPLAPNEAAAKALQCLKDRARLCSQSVQSDEQMEIVEDILRQPVAGPSFAPESTQACPRQLKSKFSH